MALDERLLLAAPRQPGPSEAWLRVHSDGHQYGLMFRDIRREAE